MIIFRNQTIISLFKGISLATKTGANMLRRSIHHEKPSFDSLQQQATVLTSRKDFPRNTLPTFRVFEQMVFKMHSNLYSKNEIYNSLMFCSCIHRSGKMLCGKRLFLEKHVLNELRDLRDLFTHVLTSLVETTTSAFSAGCYTAVFSVVTQHSSQQTAAENRTTFLYRGQPIRIQLPFSESCLRYGDSSNHSFAFIVAPCVNDRTIKIVG